MPYLPDALLGAKILIVEDEYFLADYVSSVIESAGGSIIGPFASAGAALDFLDQEPNIPSAATLNVHLSDGPSFPVASELAKRGIPFVFLTALSSTSIPSELRSRPLLAKPFAAYQVIQALVTILEDQAAASSNAG